MAKNSIKKLKRNSKSIQLTQNKSGKKQERNEQLESHRETQSKMIDINPTISIIT